MFKYLQRFPFIDKDICLYKAFQGDNLDTAEWIKSIKDILKLYGQGNLIQKIFKKVGEKLVKTVISLNISYFKKDHRTAIYK